MSKELIFKLRSIALLSDRADVREATGQAADALEAKAAPVGEREAFEAAYAECVESGWSSVKHLGRLMFEKGATHQRQQAREVVMPERKECDDGYPSDDWLCANAWNACLDEFARLNKGASHGNE